MPRQVALAEEREGGDDEGLDDEDDRARLQERLEAIAPPDRDDAGQAAQEDEGRQLEGAVHRARDDGQDRGHDDGHLGVEEDGDQDRDRRHGHDEGQGQAPGGQLQGKRREDQQEADQDEDVVAVPEVAPEAPDPAQQHDHEEGAEQEPAGLGPRGRARRRRARRRSIRAASTSVSRVPPRTMTSPWRTSSSTGCDGRHAPVALLVGELLAEGAVGDDVGGDQLGGEHPLGLRRPPAICSGEPVAGRPRPRCP